MKTSTKIWMCLAGLAIVALGIICLIYPGNTILSMAWLIGLMFFISGCSSFVAWFDWRRLLPQSGLLFLSALLQIILGFVMVICPEPLAIGLPFIFSLWLLFEGVSIFVHSFDFKRIGFHYWWLLLCIGLIATILGTCGLLNPEVGAKTLTYIVSIGIILTGIGYWVKLYAISKVEKKLKQIKERFDFLNAEEVKSEEIK